MLPLASVIDEKYDPLAAVISIPWLTVVELRPIAEVMFTPSLSKSCDTTASELITKP